MSEITENNSKNQIFYDSKNQIFCVNCNKAVDDIPENITKNTLILHEECSEEWKEKERIREETESKIVIANCIFCDKPIFKLTNHCRIKNDNSYLHEDCVSLYKKYTLPNQGKCKFCNTDLDDCYVLLQDKDGNKIPLHSGNCELEMRQQISPKCFECGKSINEKGIEINGNPYHLSCKPEYNTQICCSHCSELCEGEYVKLTIPGKDQAQLHTDCIEAYKEAHSHTCPQCSKKILDSSASECNGQLYHVSCAEDMLFQINNKVIGTCSQCNNDIIGTKYIKGGDNILLHTGCQLPYMDSKFSKCFVCNDYIMGTYFNISSVEDGEKIVKSYHKKCYKIDNVEEDEIPEEDGIAQNNVNNSFKNKDNDDIPEELC